MALIKLPITGDFIDPNEAEVAGIYIVDYMPPNPEFLKAVIIQTKLIRYAIPCKSHTEAEAIRDSQAIRLGFVEEVFTPKPKAN